jgi:hypothetical protein
MRALAALLLATALSGCGFAEQCLLHSNEEFARGLVKRLAQEGISSEARKDKGGVCFARRHAQRVIAIDEDLKKHFYSVAIYLPDECREKAMVEWASRSGLDFGVSEPAKFGGRTKGKILHLYSLSAEQVEANKKKRMEAPYKSCSPPGGAR